MKNPWKRYSKINPQREEGNRQISNEVYQALMSGKFTASDYKIILAIIHKTWGFGKQSDSIAIDQFSSMTNLIERTVQRSLKRLKDLRVIVVSPSSTRVTSGSPLNDFMFNKHYDTWKVQGCQNMQGCQVCHPLEGLKGDKQGKIRVTPMTPTKESITKETIKRKESILTNEDSKITTASPETPATSHDDKKVGGKNNKSFSKDSKEFILSEMLFNKILEHDPKRKHPNFQKWSSHIEKLLRIDKRTFDEISETIEWCQNDKFWHSNILSTEKLRIKFSDLRIKMKQQKNSKRMSSPPKDGIPESTRQNLESYENWSPVS